LTSLIRIAGTNTLAYLSPASVTKEVSFNETDVRIVPCNYCLTVFSEKETIKSWQDWSFLDVAKNKREEPPPRVSQV
jgi:hypothetical protein